MDLGWWAASISTVDPAGWVGSACTVSRVGWVALADLDISVYLVL